MTKHGRAFQRLSEELRTADARITELEARLKEAEDKLNAEMAEHTREVLRHAVTKSRAEKAEARAEAAHNAQRKVEQEALAVCAELDEATADARRLRALILSKGRELCPCWHLPKKCLKFFRENGEDARCLYCQVAALSPAEKADDEKGVKG